jgi:hypothetical protein
MIDRACVRISDPAEIAVSVRITGRLGWTHPDPARSVVGAGLDLADQPVDFAPTGYAPSKRQAAGRFSALHAEVELGATAGGLLGLLKVHLAHSDDVDESSVDELARALLRLLGIPDEEVARIVAQDLPATQPW